MTGHHLPMEQFDANARDALLDVELRRALTNVTSKFSVKRRAAVDEFGETRWQALRDRARAIKDATLARLDHYLEEFVKHAQARGTEVHWARDADDACRIFAEIAAACGANTVAKSKSMTSEEIRLGEHLEGLGLDSIETDLGEWIVQQAGHVPSHIVAPAIHMTREQIAKLFAEKVGTSPDADAGALAAAARVVLRDAFARAELGISGVNFAVAETGTILVLENEGNARFSTSLPKVHVALMGIEKVIPRFEDLDVFLKLLPRSGSGQHLTSYQSLITGPKRSPDDEGPDRVHVVLLDNGRSRMLARDVTRQSLACIRCGACLNVCPVYQSVGGHAYGSVYPGPIGAVITPQLQGIGKAAQLPYASSLCGACRDVCPVKIDIPALLLDLRAEVVGGADPVGSPFASQARPHKRGERLGFRVWSWLVRGRRRYELAAWCARVGQHLLVRDGRVRGGFGPLAAWTGSRDLRPLAKRSFRAHWRKEGRP